VSGLKGTVCGGACVSEKHAGFIINLGGATFDDVVSLEKLVVERVLENTGVLLEREVEIIK
jgi:UDP-N-acetylmuramate dehydrogenase